MDLEYYLERAKMHMDVFFLKCEVAVLVEEPFNKHAVNIAIAQCKNCFVQFFVAASTAAKFVEWYEFSFGEDLLAVTKKCRDMTVTCSVMLQFPLTLKTMSEIVSMKEEECYRAIASNALLPMLFSLWVWLPKDLVQLICGYLI